MSDGRVPQYNTLVFGGNPDNTLVIFSPYISGGPIFWGSGIAASPKNGR